MRRDLRSVLVSWHGKDLVMWGKDVLTWLCPYYDQKGKGPLVLKGCYCPHCVHGFRTWLTTQYRSPAAMNRDIGTAFSSFDEVTPPLITERFEKPGIFWLWMKYRDWAYVHTGGELPEKLPSVHVVHAGGYLQCTTYLVVGSEGAVLVDPGSGSLEGEVIEGIRKSSVALEEIKFALLTHCHVDHARGAYRFWDRGMQLIASPAAAQVLAPGGHQVWYEFPDFVIPTAMDLRPSDGETLTLCGMGLQAIHTPGHTDGCAAYLVQTTDGLAAFTGDLIAGRGHPGWAGSEGF